MSGSSVMTMILFNGIAMVVALYLFSIVFQYDLKDTEYFNINDWQNVVDMHTIHQDSPAKCFLEETKSYQFGRYRKPLPDMNLHELTNSQKVGQRKEFVWTAVSDGDWFIGCALLQFSYSSGAIVYAYNPRLNVSITTHLEAPILSFLGAHFTPNASTSYSSAVSGCAKWNFLGLNATKCYDGERATFDVSITGTSKKSRKTYEINYSISMTEDAMGLIFPIGPRRPSLVTKMGGAIATASIRQQDQLEVVLQSPLGLMDYTRGLLRRVTLWHWSALVWRSKNGRFGMQLSEGTYDDAKNVSLESTLWIDGRARHINSRIVYTQLDTSVPPQMSEWKVESDDGFIRLVFSPIDVFIGDFHYGILDGSLYHIVGSYSGTIDYVDDASQNRESEFIKAIPGTLEDHYAKW